MDQEFLGRIWKRRAAALTVQFNLAWWLERFNGLLLVGLGLVAVVVLIVRSVNPDALSASVVAISMTTLVPGAALLAWLLARGRFVSRDAGLVRLEDRLSLHNRLSAAAAGRGLWPELPPGGSKESAFRWNLARAVLPVVAGLVLVAIAWWMPLPAANRGAAAPSVEPGAWEQMEEWLETLKEEELIAEERIEEIETKIEELRNRPEEDWFSHNSLEATDTLRETLGTELREIANELGTLAKTMNDLRAFSGKMSDEARAREIRDFEKALEAMEKSGLGVNQELLDRLGDIDPSQLGQETMKNLSAEQLAELQQQLKDARSVLGSLEGLPSLGEESAEGQPGFGEGGAEMPGKGAISRGRGDAPLSLQDKEDNLGTSKLERVSNEDLSRAALGEVLGLGETERKIDEAAPGSNGGGAINGVGRGGDAVSRQALVPEEQAILKRYFK